LRQTTERTERNLWATIRDLNTFKENGFFTSLILQFNIAKKFLPRNRIQRLEAILNKRQRTVGIIMTNASNSSFIRCFIHYYSKGHNKNGYRKQYLTNFVTLKCQSRCEAMNLSWDVNFNFTEKNNIETTKYMTYFSTGYIF
jgi:hypothetical protein